MPSLYAQYLEERTKDQLLEMREGFATYRYLNGHQVYIIDIFVIPSERKKGIASLMADRICLEAKDKGCTELIGTINPSANGATESMKVLLAYGMHLVSCETNVIVLKKRI